MSQFDIYLEIGKKKTFACAVDWLGWCRSGKSEDAALEALLDYGKCYAEVMHHAGINFQAPGSIEGFRIIAKYEGNATTDSGAPRITPAVDKCLITEEERQEYQKLLRACWQVFDEAVSYTEGKELRKGPRGGGRDLEKIVQHILEADLNYLKKQGQKIAKDQQGDLYIVRQAILETLQVAVNGEIPERGPRGGAMWSTPYFMRRVVWHILDHAWEIEDRVFQN